VAAGGAPPQIWPRIAGRFRDNDDVPRSRHKRRSAGVDRFGNYLRERISCGEPLGGRDRELEHSQARIVLAPPPFAWNAGASWVRWNRQSSALDSRGRSMKTRAQREVFRKNVGQDRDHKHRRADPEPRRMMDAPPVARRNRDLFPVAMQVPGQVASLPSNSMTASAMASFPDSGTEWLAMVFPLRLPSGSEGSDRGAAFRGGGEMDRVGNYSRGRTQRPRERPRTGAAWANFCRALLIGAAGRTFLTRASNSRARFTRMDCSRPEDQPTRGARLDFQAEDRSGRYADDPGRPAEPPVARVDDEIVQAPVPSNKNQSRSKRELKSGREPSSISEAGPSAVCRTVSTADQDALAATHRGYSTMTIAITTIAIEGEAHFAAVRSGLAAFGGDVRSLIAHLDGGARNEVDALSSDATSDTRVSNCRL